VESESLLAKNAKTVEHLCKEATFSYYFGTPPPLTEAEAAFRIHKSDLRIRPIWHQKQERVEAHILVCFLAYVLWKTLG